MSKTLYDRKLTVNLGDALKTFAVKFNQSLMLSRLLFNQEIKPEAKLVGGEN